MSIVDIFEFSNSEFIDLNLIFTSHELEFLLLLISLFLSILSDEFSDELTYLMKFWFSQFSNFSYDLFFLILVWIFVFLHGVSKYEFILFILFVSNSDMYLLFLVCNWLKWCWFLISLIFSWIAISLWLKFGVLISLLVKVSILSKLIFEAEILLWFKLESESKCYIFCLLFNLFMFLTIFNLDFTISILFWWFKSSKLFLFDIYKFGFFVLNLYLPTLLFLFILFKLFSLRSLLDKHKLLLLKFLLDFLLYVSRSHD